MLKEEDGEIYQYNIDSFIANLISEKDRIQVKESKTEIDFSITCPNIRKKWDERLLYGKEWIKEYQNFLLYIPAKNVTQLKEKI